MKTLKRNNKLDTVMIYCMDKIGKKELTLKEAEHLKRKLMRMELPEIINYIKGV
jgi:hypothetical protein